MSDENDLMRLSAYWTTQKDSYALLKSTLSGDTGEQIVYYDIVWKDEAGLLYPLNVETEPVTDLKWETLQEAIQNMIAAGCEVIDLDNLSQADRERLHP